MTVKKANVSSSIVVPPVEDSYFKIRGHLIHAAGGVGIKCCKGQLYY